MGLMVRRRRPVARAAMMAGGAAVAYQAGKESGQGQGQDQQATAEPQVQQAPPPAAPAAPAGGASTADQLMQLKQLLDEGVLTQAEFEAQKQKVLSGS
jgi:membrane protease subunit (stomatin/prohibitin family)